MGAREIEAEVLSTALPARPVDEVSPVRAA